MEHSPWKPDSRLPVRQIPHIYRTKKFITFSKQPTTNLILRQLHTTTESFLTWKWALETGSCSRPLYGAQSRLNAELATPSTGRAGGIIGCYAAIQLRDNSFLSWTSCIIFCCTNSAQYRRRILLIPSRPNTNFTSRTAYPVPNQMSWKYQAGPQSFTFSILIKIIVASPRLNFTILLLKCGQNCFPSFLSNQKVKNASKSGCLILFSIPISGRHFERNDHQQFYW
jgi:hypothetical protein